MPNRLRLVPYDMPKRQQTLEWLNMIEEAQVIYKHVNEGLKRRKLAEVEVHKHEMRD